MSRLPLFATLIGVVTAFAPLPLSVGGKISSAYSGRESAVLGELPNPADMVGAGIATRVAATQLSKNIPTLSKMFSMINGLQKKEIDKRLVDNIQSLAEARRVLPAGVVSPKPIRIVVSGLAKLVLNSYKPACRGATQVVYTPPSLGKTTAFEAFTTRRLPDGAAALMIRGYRSSSGSYASHMADVLGVDDMEDLLVYLFEALKTERPNFSSVLVLDEMNSPGVGNCNIQLIDGMMRYIYEQQLGISLYVVTQNKEVGQALCALNAWQKIGPLEGLTSPTRSQVMGNLKDLPPPDEDVWDTDKMSWTQNQLSRCVLAEYPDLQTDGDGLISWVRDGMTPTAALYKAEEARSTYAREPETVGR